MRILAFPVCTAAVVALTGCDGVSVNDPSVRACHSDTTAIEIRSPNGAVTKDTVIVAYPWQHCRKAA